MEEDTVVRLPRPGGSVADDPLLEVLRSGARRMLQRVIEAEVEIFLGAHADLEDERGRRRVVRNGHAPEREIQTGIGPIVVRRPKLRDRGDGTGSEPIRFTSKVLPPFLRRDEERRRVAALALPEGRLHGPVRGGADGAARPRCTRAFGLDGTPPRRHLAAGARPLARHLSTRRYVYLWADGIYFTPRLDHDRQCMLVLIGADAAGKKELLAIEDGYRESTQSWRELLLRLRDDNGLAIPPELAIGDGALGFWKALHEVWPSTRQQRCWVHKTANVLNVLPKSVHGKAKKALHAISEAESRAAAEAAFDRFTGKFGAKYDKAAACLVKDRTALLAFYDFPAEPWKHVRSSNPIESTFATVRLRTDKTKGCLSRETALAMVFKLAKAAERHWRRLNGPDRLGQLIEGVRFRDGEAVQDAEEQAAA